MVTDSEGLGTSLQMRPGKNPIRGITILQMPNPTLRHLALRLPQSMKDLEPITFCSFRPQTDIRRTPFQHLQY